MFKQNVITLFVIQYIPFAMAFIIALLLPSAIKNQSDFGLFCISLFAIGFLLFFISKIINFKKGIVFSFGNKSSFLKNTQQEVAHGKFYLEQSSLIC